jgi:hypothetical protein
MNERALRGRNMLNTSIPSFRHSVIPSFRHSVIPSFIELNIRYTYFLLPSIFAPFRAGASA